MSTRDENVFKFGLEVEFMLVASESFRPLWHPNLRFEDLNALLESIPAEDFNLEDLKVEPPHRKRMPFVVEGYHLPDTQLNPINLLPKGIEIRTPPASSIEECLANLIVLYDRLQSALATMQYQAVVISFHPFEHEFEGPQNKRRYDFWQWAMRAMLTYGPDVNVTLPKRLAEQLDLIDLHARANYYAPAAVALTAASPLYRGNLWRIRGRIGKSVRTYHRSVIAPALEIHPDQNQRLEFKPLEMAWRVADFHNYFLVWLELVLDTGLKGRASNESRIYDLGQVARHGVDAETVRDRAGELLDRANATLPSWGFAPQALESFRRRLVTGRVPADEIIALYEQEQTIPGTLEELAKQTFTDRASVPETVSAEVSSGRIDASL